MTMSISSAPASTASWVSASLMSIAARPLGNAVATAATLTPESPSVLLGDGDHVGVDADGGGRRGSVGSAGSGRIALADSARTLPGVSAPSSVVRSTIRIARSRAYALDVVLIERVPSPAARASAPTWSTPGSPCRKRRSEESERVISVTSPGRARRRGERWLSPGQHRSARGCAGQSGRGHLHSLDLYKYALVMWAMDLTDALDQIGAVRRGLSSLDHHGKPARALTAEQTYDAAADGRLGRADQPGAAAALVPAGGGRPARGRPLPAGRQRRRHHRALRRRRASLAVTWEYGERVSWVEVDLTEADGATTLVLRHIAHAATSTGTATAPARSASAGTSSLLGLAASPGDRARRRPGGRGGVVGGRGGPGVHAPQQRRLVRRRRRRRRRPRRRPAAGRPDASPSTPAQEEPA